MPELNPCPACNNVESIIHMSFIAGKTIWFVECDDDNCAHHGKACFTEAAAIAAWNSLPRALTWTTEPPKVAGWYWCMDIDKSEGYPIISYYDDWAISTVLPKINQGKVRFEWAGPIPTPLEQEES